MLNETLPHRRQGAAAFAGCAHEKVSGTVYRQKEGKYAETVPDTFASPMKGGRALLSALEFLDLSIFSGTLPGNQIAYQFMNGDYL